MDHLQTYSSRIRTLLVSMFLLHGFITIVGTAVALAFLPAPYQDSLAIMAVTTILSALLLGAIATDYVLRPIRFIWKTVLYIAPNTASADAPDPKKLRLGRELVTALSGHIYQLANVAETIQKLASSKKPDLKADFVASSLPLPLIVLGKDLNILFANEAFLAYTSRTTTDTVGQNIYLVLDLLFTNKHTFDSWLTQVRENKVTATHTWERVRLNLPDKKETKLFDLVAYYNKSNPEGFEVMLTLFDRTRQYSQDEQAMSFLALAVHELRTPLTLLRGYIDVFEEELGGKLTPELEGYLAKMKATAQQLTGFIGNVLNVSRFENDQLRLTLREEKWAPLLTAAVEDVELRAKIRGITLKLEVDDNLPAAGVDAASIYEVINNLLDNAIKYSKENTQISIRSHVTSNGLIETSVQDYGVGIPETAIGSLFDKFYRDYRNRAQVGGTGMGLYLSKAIISAHGGNIWVRSKEGEGSTFSFTLLPFSDIASDKKDGHSGIVRTAHGWIKNHSMYRR